MAKTAYPFSLRTASAKSPTESQSKMMFALTEYSGAVRRLLERGTYNAGTRPSEHHIGAKALLASHWAIAA